MLSFFRALLDTWAAKLFFFVLVAAFALWGIGDVVRNVGHDNALATVGGRKIEIPEFQEAFRRDMAQVTRMMGGRGEPTPAVRKTVAEQTLDRLIIQAAIAEEVQRLGLVVSDASLRQSVFDVPAFRGPSGTFDRATFDNVMRNNGLSEGRFLELTRANLLQQQVMSAAQAGVATPEVPLRAFYAYQHQTREGEVVELPLTAAAEPPTPSDDDLQRQYDNNTTAYSAPEYRRIKLVVLSPQTLARGIEVSDEDIKAYYDAHRADYQSEEQRAADVIVTGDETVARDLAAAWSAGADWPSMQKAAAEKSANAVAVDLSVRQQFPSPELADAVFKAAPSVVTGPVKSAFGWQVFQVTKVQPEVSRRLEAVRDEVKGKIAEDRAADLVYARAQKLEDALSAGTSLDDLPGDLGLIAVSGTLDAQGKTPAGEDAPLPGSPELRTALINAAFATNKGDAPRMVEGPGQSDYALQVEEITPAAVRPFAEVREQVDEDWAEAQRRREQEVKASKLMVAAQAGGSLDDAAVIAGLRMEKTPSVTRDQPPAPDGSNPIAPEVQAALFRLNQGETTMVSTAGGFAVVRLTTMTDPDPAQDPAGAAQLREALNKSLDQDVAVVLATALRDRAQPRVNRTLLHTLVE